MTYSDVVAMALTFIFVTIFIILASGPIPA